MKIEYALVEQYVSVFVHPKTGMRRVRNNTNDIFVSSNYFEVYRQGTEEAKIARDGGWIYENNDGQSNGEVKLWHFRDNLSETDFILFIQPRIHVEQQEQQE